jgi:hypothetical protein
MKGRSAERGAGGLPASGTARAETISALLKQLAADFGERAQGGERERAAARAAS